MLGGYRIQTSGPEAGLWERADQATIVSYYADVLADRMVGPGRVEHFPGCDYLGDRQFVSRISGERYEVPERCRIVDARYLAPDIPAETPPRFAVEEGARVVPVNELVRLDEAPSQYVVVGSGKTATDACVWLLTRGVDPDAICWVRPREPWMLNRALVVPDPAIYLPMLAKLLEAATTAASLDQVFLRLEDAGIMLRIDRRSLPPWRGAHARPVGARPAAQHRDVVRLGHIRSVRRGRLELDEGTCGSPTTRSSSTARPTG